MIISSLCVHGSTFGELSRLEYCRSLTNLEELGRVLFKGEMITFYALFSIICQIVYGQLTWNVTTFGSSSTRVNAYDVAIDASGNLYGKKSDKSYNISL